MKLKTIETTNAQFQFFGIDNMMMLACSGSYFIFQWGLISVYLASKIVNSIAKKYAHHEIMRIVGIKVYENTKFTDFKSLSQKLFIENYFPLSIANFVNLLAVYENHDNFKQFFDGFGNWTNSVLLVFYTILITNFGIYYHIKIYKNYEVLHEIQDEHMNFLD